jgi:hypothetical protein
MCPTKTSPRNRFQTIWDLPETKCGDSYNRRLVVWNGGLLLREFASALLLRLLYGE